MRQAVDVDVIVTCTDRKSAAAAPSLLLRSLPRDPIELRAAEWINRLETVSAPSLAASALYTGNTWHIVRSIAASGAELGIALRMWIASAGYGLVPFDAPLKAYAATFSGGPDSVGGVRDAKVWWRALSGWPGPVRGQPRSISELVERADGPPVFLAASPAYLRAMQDDIADAGQNCGPERLVLASAGSGVPPVLRRYVLEADGRFRAALGGQFPALNTRILGEALRIWATSRDVAALRTEIANRRNALPPFTPHEGRGMTDEDVIAFIHAERLERPDAGHTQLLRALRASGRACEQKRFRSLFRSLPSHA